MSGELNREIHGKKPLKKVEIHFSNHASSGASASAGR
jgi:hypothetical protein